jgi:O-antigen ligase
MTIKFSKNQIIPTTAFVIGVVYAGVGILKYGFWDDINGPRSGFFPIIAGCVMVATSLVAFFQSFKDKSVPYRLEDMAIVLAVAIALGVSYLIGLIPSMILMVFLWLKFFEKVNLRSSLIVTAVISAIVLGVFVFWLNVPYHWGLIGYLFQ